jgi:hypothetical protein
MAHAIEGGKCNGGGKVARLWASRRPEEANTWSCTELFPSPCARQEQRSSAGLVSLLERDSAGIKLFLGAALRAGTGPLWWVAEDAHLRLQTGRHPPCKRRSVADRFRDKIQAQGRNELEMRRLSRTSPNLLLGLGKKFAPNSILDFAKRMVGENIAERDSLQLTTDFLNGIKPRRRLQERFGVYFPAPSALWGVTGRFCFAAGFTTKAHELPQQPKQPQP